jgi:4-hydroxybenzoate polyprenyltransferase
MYQFSLIGLGMGTPCIPHFSTSSGLHLFKPKSIVSVSSPARVFANTLQFREAKSLVVAVCMGYIAAEISMYHFCHKKDVYCNERSIRTRSLCLVVLYQYFREISCDVRDIEEDTRDGLKTLPIRLGKINTLLLMATIGALLDTLLTKSLLITQSGIQINLSLLASSVLRVGTLIEFYAKILQYPRENHFGWGAMSLLGLVPVLWAQASLSG